MKRTAKILSFLLAIMLIFGVTAVISFAAAEDITVAKQAGFDGGVVPSDVKWTANTAVGGTEVVQGVDDNYYWKFTKAESYGANTAYAYTYMQFNRQVLDATGTAFTNTNYQISNFKFISYEVDLMSPTGSFMNGNIDPYWAAIKTGTTSNNFWYSAATQSLVNFTTDETGSYIYPAYDKTVKVYINPFEFTHIQIVWENISPADDIKIKGSVYVNGELAYSKEATSSNFAKDAYAIEPHVSFYHSKLNVNVKTCRDNDSLAIDNIKVSTVPAGSETVETDLLNYDANNRPLGIPQAEVGDVKYDNVAKAIAACPEEGTVKLLANSTSPIVVDKMITIDANGFEGTFVPGEGYAIDDTVEGIYKVISSAGQTIEVIWDDCFDCECGDDFDANHPVNNYAELAIYTKFLDVYNPKYTGPVGNDGKIYTLVGWEDIATGEMLTPDSAVTEELLAEGFIELKPVYEEAVLDLIYVKGGEPVYVGAGDATLADVLSLADAGSTITLMNDVEITSTITIPGKAITLDLNGYTVKAMAKGSNTKWIMFKLSSGTQLTVTSSKVGAKIFNEGFNGNPNTFGAAGMFQVSSDTAKLYIDARDGEGNNTISFFTGNFLQGYSNALEYHIDGGFYVSNGGDQQGFIDLRKAGWDSTIENATFYGYHQGGAITYAGRNHQVDDTPTVTVDNCVFVNIAPTHRVVSPVVMTITNSYIYADITAAKSGTYSKHSDACACPTVDGNVILGEGVYMTGSTSGNVAFAEGYNFYNVPSQKEVTYQIQAWATNGTDYEFLPSSYEVTTAVETLAFDKQTSNVPLTTITVTWKNAEGEVIGTSQALPGTEAIVPTDLKGTTFIDKWLDYVPAEWATDLMVPVDAESYEIIAKEGGEVTLQGAVEFLASYTLQSHAQTNLFIPSEAEGIVITKLSFNGTDRLANMNGNYKYNINGYTYKYTAIWPGVMSIYNDFKAEITFTYGGNTYTSTAVLNVAKYAAYVLDDANGYSEAGQAVAANFANYVYTLAVARGSAKAATLADLVNNNTELLYKIPEGEKVATDMSSVSAYVSGVGITITDYAPNFTFKVVENTGATIKVNGVVATQTANTRFTNIDTVWLNVVPAEGEPIDVQFSLAGFYAHLAADGASDTTLALVEAMYGVAKADVNY